MKKAVAIILAAGLGSRLAPMTKDLPKGLVRCGEQSLIAHSIDRLRAAGVMDIRVVIGHSADRFKDALAGQDGITLIYNPDYASMGSLQSLLVGLADLPAGEGPVLVLESDIVYEARAIPLLLARHETHILVSGPTGAGDEVFVWIDDDAPQNDQLRLLSKQADAQPDPFFGELTGLNSIAREDLAHFIDICRDVQAENVGAHYEDGMVAAARSLPLRCVLVPDLVWGEIDDVHMLARVRDQVWPEIIRRDRAT